MDTRRNLLGILFCLVCGFSCGDLGWPSLNMDLLDEDIRKEVDQALQVVNQASFQGWSLELVKQAAPRMHVALVELWLQVRKLQKDQDEMRRKMKRMMRMSAASCQELKDKLEVLRVPERMEKIEEHVEVLEGRVKTMEEERQVASNRSKVHLEENVDSSEQQPCPLQSCATSDKGPRKGRVNTTQLAHKVAALSELLNGHNELLVELYQRMTALEEVNEARRTSHTQDGRGHGH